MISHDFLLHSPSRVRHAFGLQQREIKIREFQIPTTNESVDPMYGRDFGRRTTNPICSAQLPFYHGDVAQ